MYIPNMAKKTYSNDIVINGRLEELVLKPFFRGLLEKKRCIIAIQGYYEWVVKTGQPILIRPTKPNTSQHKEVAPKHESTEETKQSDKINDADEEGTRDQILYAACLYNNAFKQDGSLGEEHNNFVILTMEACEKISSVHHRMPVLLNEQTKVMWLDPEVSFKDCYHAIYNSDVIKGQDLEFFEVSDLVSSVKNQS